MIRKVFILSQMGNVSFALSVDLVLFSSSGILLPSTHCVCGSRVLYFVHFES